ncbi:MAG TPA: hypothetical protein VFQ45_08760 [Longimicrobium sp.]|nr:hypothetical protein [Longimicrobium sp.]
MPSNDYHFVTHWRLRGNAREVSDILGDAESLSRWWPSVYLDVRQVEPGDEAGVGRVVELHTRGWLPYTLRWSFRVTRADAPRGFVIEAWGDFAGRGEWIIAQDGACVDVTFDWRVRADKPLLRRLSWLLRPLFAANHRWAMRMGERSLALELARRRAAEADQAVAAVPASASRYARTAAR